MPRLITALTFSGSDSKPSPLTALPATTYPYSHPLQQQGVQPTSVHATGTSVSPGKQPASPYIFNLEVGAVDAIKVGAVGAADVLGFYAGYGLRCRAQRGEIPSGIKALPAAWQEGLLKPRNLMRGAGPYAANIFPAYAIQIGVGEELKRALPTYMDVEPDSTAVNVISYTTAGACSGVPMTAFTNVIVRQQNNRSSTWSEVRNINRDGLVRALRRVRYGLGPSIVRDSGFAPTVFCGEKVVKEASARLLSPDGVTPVVSDEVASLIAGTLGGAGTHPFDTLATNAQNHRMPALAALKKSMKNETSMAKFLSRGGLFRVSTIVGAAYVLPRVTEVVDDMLRCSK